MLHGVESVYLKPRRLRANTISRRPSGASKPRRSLLLLDSAAAEGLSAVVGRGAATNKDTSAAGVADGTPWCGYSQ